MPHFHPDAHEIGEEFYKALDRFYTDDVGPPIVPWESASEDNRTAVISAADHLLRRGIIRRSVGGPPGVVPRNTAQPVTESIPKGDFL